MGKDYIRVNKDGTGELFIFSEHYGTQEDHIQTIFDYCLNDDPENIKFVIDVKAFIKEKFRK